MDELEIILDNLFEPPLLVDDECYYCGNPGRYSPVLHYRDRHCDDAPRCSGDIVNKERKVYNMDMRAFDRLGEYTRRYILDNDPVLMRRLYITYEGVDVEQAKAKHLDKLVYQIAAMTAQTSIADIKGRTPYSEME